MQRKLIAVGSALAAFSPLAALAFTPPSTTSSSGGGLGGSIIPVINDIITIVGALVPFMLTLAVLYFLWGLAKFVLAAGDEGARESGRSIMIWGVIAITVMVSLWGLVALLQEIFSVDASATYAAPPVPIVTI